MVSLMMSAPTASDGLIEVEIMMLKLVAAVAAVAAAKSFVTDVDVVLTPNMATKPSVAVDVLIVPVGTLLLRARIKG